MKKLASIAKAIFPEPGTIKFRKIVQLIVSPFGDPNKHTCKYDMSMQHDGCTALVVVIDELCPKRKTEHNDFSQQICKTDL